MKFKIWYFGVDAMHIYMRKNQSKLFVSTLIAAEFFQIFLMDSFLAEMTENDLASSEKSFLVFFFSLLKSLMFRLYMYYIFSNIVISESFRTSDRCEERNYKQIREKSGNLFSQSIFLHFSCASLSLFSQRSKFAQEKAWLWFSSRINQSQCKQCKHFFCTNWMISSMDGCENHSFVRGIK